MNKVAILEEKSLLFKGGERSSYEHPSFNNRIIKIEHDSSINKQNELEYKYYKYLKENNSDLSLIAECFGFCDTNKGIGLVFEKIIDYDFNISKPFRYYLRNNLLSKKIELELLEELKTYLFKNKILFVDVSTVNVLCKKLDKDNYRLIIIDGLGARRLNFKYYMYLYIPFLKEYKIKKQWEKFIFNYKRDKKLN